MLLSGVESLLDSSVCAVIEELCTGLPESISTELMAVSEPNVGLDAKSGVSMPVLGHSDSLSAEHHRTSAAENFCQKTEDLGDLLKVISHGPAESLTEALLKAGDLEKDETNKKRNFRKLDCCSDGYQKEDKEAQVAEDYHAECCALTPGESGSEQENPHLQQHEVKSWTMCGTGTAGSPKSTGGKQASIQVTAETLPKLTEEVQAMPCYHTSLYRAWKRCRPQVMRYAWKPHSLSCYQSLAHFQNHCRAPLGFQHPSSRCMPSMMLMCPSQPVLDPKMTQN
ncbi:protein PRR14L isoform X4 [Melanerpes formicivorus]|uniref:protein PRR14L isoform X4 n=1 Tax=Melanerpes formicivorus TaxID=211600 RepID=UPI00358E6E53